MPLSVRDPRAETLARKLADRRGTTMTYAFVFALQAAIEADQAKTPLSKRVALIAANLRAKGAPGGKDLSPDERDELWGH